MGGAVTNSEVKWRATESEVAHSNETAIRQMSARWKATETGSSTGPMVTVRSPRLSRPMKQVEEVASAQRRSRPVACMVGSSRGVWRRLRSPGARSLL